MRFISILFMLTALLCVSVKALPATISQGNDDSTGGWKNEVNGPGASGNTYSQSSTTITSYDGSSIVSNKTVTSTSGGGISFEVDNLELLYVLPFILFCTFLTY